MHLETASLMQALWFIFIGLLPACTPDVRCSNMHMLGDDPPVQSCVTPNNGFKIAATHS